MTKKIGWAFLVLSTLFFLVPFLIPFFTMSTKMKVAIGGVALVAAEVLFWVGALLVGKETVQKYTKRFFKKKEKDS
ncbi:transporter suffix domain-containing protein [Anoxybacillus sp. ST4]|uniref:transporter suffix domain-containing protein n=1 Tax=Anoxybacillus sp. ST4 TaxID=2864181 RepID=UPI001C63D324|nr:transporter suffix domain-containing protein [Anoxybacillus sp. ST4]